MSITRRRNPETGVYSRRCGVILGASEVVAARPNHSIDTIACEQVDLFVIVLTKGEDNPTA